MLIKTENKKSLGLLSVYLFYNNFVKINAMVTARGFCVLVTQIRCFGLQMT